MTCDKCIALKHYACAGKRGGECTCSVCGSSIDRIKQLRDPKPRKRKPEVYKPQGPTTDRGKAKVKYGVRTDFTPEEIALVFQRKAEGGALGTISAIARELGTTRDRVRTIFKAPTSPDPACPHCGRPW